MQILSDLIEDMERVHAISRTHADMAITDPIRELGNTYADFITGWIIRAKEIEAMLNLNKLASQLNAEELMRIEDAAKLFHNAKALGFD